MTQTFVGARVYVVVWMVSFDYYACWEWGVVVWYAVSKWPFSLDLDLTSRPCIDSTLQATLPVYSLPSDRWDRRVWVTCWLWIVRVVIVDFWVLAQGFVILIHDDCMQHVDVYMLWLMVSGPYRTNYLACYAWFWMLATLWVLYEHDLVNGTLDYNLVYCSWSLEPCMCAYVVLMPTLMSNSHVYHARLV